MKVELWYIGKTAFPYLKEGMAIYEKRLKKYFPFQTVLIPDVKNARKMSPKELKQKEGDLILKKIKKEDFLILLDEKGKEMASVQFAEFLEKKLHLSHKKLIFQIGGAYGFSETIYKRANAKLALSKMTFSHQMIRLFVLEQLYRGMSILNNEPYHNE